MVHVCGGGTNKEMTTFFKTFDSVLDSYYDLDTW